MGVPALFRWLSEKYPKITSTVVEDETRDIDGNLIAVNTADPNPNGEEFDNLYLDMNGIIHPCCHPEDKPAPTTEDEMYIEIFKYIDRIFAMVRPRKLLYMAIDGVAPRAKMNQQRSRRFRAAQEMREKDEKKRMLREELGIDLDDIVEGDNGFDSNCITPGTPFMDKLALNLKFYIAKRLNNDPGWKNVKVILSDASVPSEGEHKIMDYIRRQRSDPGHDTNTSHVLYGLDADLIMLALATHEPHFKILREDVFYNERFKRQTCYICNKVGHVADDCKKKRLENTDGEEVVNFAQKPFIFLHVNILREYLEVELKVENSPVLFDLERAIDDWVFMCFFVGNDFLPHLPSLEIREGAIDSLLQIYKKNLPLFGGYVTENGFVDVEKIELFMQELGLLEDEVFRKRKEREERRKANIKRHKSEFSASTGTDSSPLPTRNYVTPINKPPMDVVKLPPPKASDSNSNMDAAAKLKNLLKGLQATKSASSDSNSPVKKRKVEEISGSEGVAGDEESNAEGDDEVRLWESGWKQRYYRSKFRLEVSDTEEISKIVKAYVEGLSWVLLYYYQGCPSWNWYYPYHYAPFASDFANVGKGKLEFKVGEPFKPLEQLMSVLPAASSSLIPEGLRPLMSDPDSAIIDFYPEDFEVDLNGKRWAWQGVVILPFIDETRLLAEVRQKYKDLTEDDLRLNEKGSDLLYVGRVNKLYDFLCDLYGAGDAADAAYMIDTSLSEGMAGSCLCDPDVYLPGCCISSPLIDFADIEKETDLRDIDDNSSISAIFFGPKLNDGEVFSADLKDGARFAKRVLDSYDHHLVRMGGPTRGRGRGRRGGRFGGSHGQDSMHMDVASRMMRHYTGAEPERQRPPPQAPIYYSQQIYHNQYVNNIYGQNGQNIQQSSYHSAEVGLNRANPNQRPPPMAPWHQNPNQRPPMPVNVNPSPYSMTMAPNRPPRPNVPTWGNVANEQTWGSIQARPNVPTWGNVSNVQTWGSIQARPPGPVPVRPPPHYAWNRNVQKSSTSSQIQKMYSSSSSSQQQPKKHQ